MKQGRAKSEGSPEEVVLERVYVDLENLRVRRTCSIEEAAQILGIGRSTAYAAARDGSLPVLRISNRILVSVPRLMVMLGVESESRS